MKTKRLTAFFLALLLGILCDWQEDSLADRLICKAGVVTSCIPEFWLSFILILTVYGRFFRLYMYTALAPLPLSSFAGEGTSFAGTAFLKSYVGVCLEGAIIVLACLIFSAFMSSGTPVVDTSLSAVTMSWQYIGETIFNMMVLVGLVKGAERIVKEMFGL